MTCQRTSRPRTLCRRLAQWPLVDPRRTVEPNPTPANSADFFDLHILRSSVRTLQQGARAAVVSSFAALLAAAAMPARAVDGCLVLLCLAAPSWRAIPQCVSPVRQLFRDLARGKPFPTCAMSGSGNSASHSWASAPSNCPPQYTRLTDGENNATYSCDYSGAVSVTVNGTPFARTWWNLAGDTVTEFSPAAKTALGRWETRFDDKHAAWLAASAAASPPAPAP
jgi:hypothetical protein